MYRQFLRRTKVSKRRLALRAGLLALTFALTAGPASPLLAGAPSSVMLSEVGKGRPGGCPSRWCACYLQKVLRRAGYAVTDSWRAIDWRSYGRPARPAAEGSIMVMRSHVGIVAGRCPNGKVKLVSGNHGHRVGVGCYPMSRAIAWREPVRGRTLAFSLPQGQEPRNSRSHTRRPSKAAVEVTANLQAFMLRRIAER